MTKSQLVKAVAEKSHLTAAQAEAAIDALSTIIQGELATPGNEVALVGVGKLKSVRKEARQAKQFGQVKDIPAHNSVRFVISSVLKSNINA